MKRLTILTVIAMMTVATSSGCRTCGSLFNFHRGDSCDTCGNGSYDSYSSNYGSGMIYEGDTMLPPPSGGALHGPAPQSP
ncbi:MAG: hypothetical protein H8E66_35320 [Planctomycetes bacterium]|nr:hypothetical protein [Planctomycetota bacterium]